MRHIKNFYQLFESEEFLNQGTSIEEFSERIGISPNMIPAVSEWWNKNRANIKIHLFPFGSQDPIAGVFLGDDNVCINDRLRMPPHIKLFLALHESRHCDQHRDNIFMDGYYNTVLNSDLDGFLESYAELEKDANDFAVESMREMGFNREMDMEERRLRSNELAGRMVYNMMKKDIDRLNPSDFFDLLKKQVL